MTGVYEPRDPREPASPWAQPPMTDPYASAAYGAGPDASRPYTQPAGQPSATPPVQPYAQTGDAQPTWQQPSCGQPTYSQPSYSQPSYGQQQYPQQPGYGAVAPSYGGPLIGGMDPTERSNASMVWWLTIFIGWIAPLIFMGADRSPFVRYHARMSMNVQLTNIIIWLVAFLLLLPTGGASLLFPWVWNLLVVIQGASKASNGETYHPPLVITFLK